MRSLSELVSQWTVPVVSQPKAVQWKESTPPHFSIWFQSLPPPGADTDRHLLVILWAFSLTVTGEQTERAVGKELGQLVRTKPITVSRQHAQIKGQYWPPCPFLGPPCPFWGHIGARIKHFSSLRIVDHPSQVSWLMGVVAGCSWADENCYQQES